MRTSTDMKKYGRMLLPGMTANIPMMCLLGVTTAMAIDYNAFKYGNRMVACSQSATGSGGKGFKNKLKAIFVFSQNSPKYRCMDKPTQRYFLISQVSACE